MAGFKDLLLERGPQIALALLAAKQGGPQAGAAFMEGLRLKAEREQQLARQAAADERAATADTRASDYHRAQMANLDADNKRLAEQQQMDKFQKALALVQQASQQQAEIATDPIQAENAVMQQAQAAASLYGLEPDTLTGFVPPMAPKLAARQKREAKTLYEAAEKRYNPKGENPQWETSITLQTTQFGDISPAKLREMYDAPAVTPTGAPALPPPAGAPGVPTTERMALAAFARERGKTPDALTSADLLAFNKQFKQSDDRPPVTVTVGGSGLTPQQVQAAAGLRDDFRLESKDFSVVRSAYDRVQASASDPSAAGDMALLFNYMKILDPNSVVRETEFRTAAQSGSLPQQIQAAALKVVNGERLTDAQRADFVNRAQKLFTAADTRQKRLMDRYRNIATKSGVPEELVVIDTGDLSVPDAADAPTGAGRVYYDMNGNPK